MAGDSYVCGTVSITSLRLAVGAVSDMTPNTLEEIRLELGIESKAGFCRALGITQATYHAWLRGDREIPFPIIRLTGYMLDNPSLALKHSERILNHH
mgnify:CR=1 FL=1